MLKLCNLVPERPLKFKDRLLFLFGKKTKSFIEWRDNNPRDYDMIMSDGKGVNPDNKDDFCFISVSTAKPGTPIRMHMNAKDRGCECMGVPTWYEPTKFMPLKDQDIIIVYKDCTRLFAGVKGDFTWEKVKKWMYYPEVEND